MQWRDIAAPKQLESFSPKTIRIIGTIQNTRLTVLIDGGSTRNFIQDSLVRLWAYKKFTQINLRSWWVTVNN